MKHLKNGSRPRRTEKNVASTGTCQAPPFIRPAHCRMHARPFELTFVVLKSAQRPVGRFPLSGPSVRESARLRCLTDFLPADGDKSRLDPPVWDDKGRSPDGS